MRKLSLSLTLSVGVALIGCAAPAPLTPVPGTSPAQVAPAFKPGDLMVNLNIRGSRALQAASDLVEIYSTDDIDTLEILPMLKVGDGDYRPLSTSGGTTTEGSEDQLKQVISTSQGIPSIVLRNLAPNSTYRVRVRAFNAQKTQISKDAVSVSGDVTLTTVPVLPRVDVPLHLEDKDFETSAQANVSFGGSLGAATQVRLTLLKKAGADPETPVGQPLELDASTFPRSLNLGRLGPNATYALRAEALDEHENVLMEGRVEWVVGNDRNLAAKDLKLVFPATVSTYAGLAMDYGYNPLPVDRLAARFSMPGQIERGPDGMLYISDTGNRRIRRIDANGTVSTWVGDGTADVKPGTGASAGIGQPRGLAFDSHGNLFVVSVDKAQILKVTTGGVVSVYAGLPYDNTLGFVSIDGPRASARFAIPQGLYIDSEDNLYVTELGTKSIRKIAGDQVTTLAGGATQYTDLAGNSTAFKEPTGLTMDPATGQLLLADGSRIWSIHPVTGAVTPVAGNGAYAEQDGPVAQASFTAARGILVHDGTLYVASERAIFAIRDGMARIVAGSKTHTGSTDGAGDVARFNVLYDLVAEADGSFLVSDLVNSTIRRVTFSTPSK